ncbi:hypothetical protein G7Y79_00004g012340 [Physcia stellaris]|nr:hypothetical protein G7Y79_00004g012340 [Physcia stellaris]
MKRLRRNLLILAILADNSTTVNAGVSNYLKCAKNATMIEMPNSSILLDHNGPAKIDIHGSDYLTQHMTSWVLPWLALTAQLPYSTSNKRSNIMALFLALGSPALMVYTLALTVTNSRTIRRKFKKCLRKCKELNLPGLAEAVDSAQTIMADSQHIPIQAYQGPQRVFSQLVVCPDTWIWWTILKDEIAAVGRISNPVLGGETGGNEAINGIRDRATSTGELQVWPNASHDLESQGNSPPGPDQQLNPLSTTFFGFSAAGCDTERGTIFNYARAWSHMHVTEHVVHSFERLVANQEHRRTVSGRKWVNSSQRWKENLEGSPADKCRYVSSTGQDQPSISTQASASPELLQNFIIAALISMITQWGTTGAAIVIAYK